MFATGSCGQCSFWCTEFERARRARPPDPCPATWRTRCYPRLGKKCIDIADPTPRIDSTESAPAFEVVIDFGRVTRAKPSLKERFKNRDSSTAGKGNDTVRRVRDEIRDRVKVLSAALLASSRFW